VGALAIIVAVAALFVSRRSPPVALADPPDVLLITIDTLRADRIGAYGYAGASTPVLDALAARGARFAEAIAPTPLTLPSHASILTATTPLKHGARDNVGFVVGPALPTLAEQFHASGYATGAFISGFPLHRRFGLMRGFDHYDDRLTRGGDSARPAPVERRADETVAAATAWLGQPPGQAPRPLFLWVHVFDPHAPYDAPAPYGARFSRQPYDGEVAFVDAQIGALLNRLDQARPGRQTLIAVTADHGEGFGEHGEPTHGLFVYDSTVRVPLVFAGPGVPAARVVDPMVRLIDVAPTLLDLSGVAPLANAEGISLRPLLTGHETRPAPAAYVESLFGWLCCGWAPLHAWRDDAWKFIDAPRAELYDTSTDPGEVQNLAASRGADVARLRRDLEAALSGEAKVAQGPSPSDARDRLRSLGYVGGGGTTKPSRRDPKDVAEVSVRIGRAIEIEEADPARAAGNPIAGILCQIAEERSHSGNQVRTGNRACLPPRVGLVHDDEPHRASAPNRRCGWRKRQKVDHGRRQDIGLHVVRLPGQLAMLGAGNGLRDRARRVLQPLIGLRPVHDERRRPDRREARTGDLELGHHGGVVREGVSDSFELAPDPPHQPHHHDHGSRRADHVLHEVLHRAAAVAAGHETLELTGERGATPLAGVVHVGRFVGNHLVDREAGGRGFERERAARGQPEEVRRSAGRRDQRRDVLHFPRWRIRLCVAALPAAAAIVGVNGEVPRQKRRELRRRPERAAAERPVDHDQRRPASGS
jgi:choline-sulfatase